MKDAERIAKVVVANIHMAHINRIASKELSAWAEGKPCGNVQIQLPTKQAVEIAQAALEGAFKDGHHEAVMLINNAMDAVTITGKKAVPVKALETITATLRGDVKP